MEDKFIRMIKENEGLIHKVCNFYEADPDNRKDLFQEIILQLWKAFPSFRNESKISTWIYRVALNTAITINKKRSQISTVHKIEPNLYPYSEDYEKEERRKLLYNAIAQLNDLDKSQMFLHLEGYSYDEISQLTGLTKTNVATRLNRIKEKITKNLKIVYQI